MVSSMCRALFDENIIDYVFVIFMVLFIFKILIQRQQTFCIQVYFLELILHKLHLIRLKKCIFWSTISVTKSSLLEYIAIIFNTRISHPFFVSYNRLFSYYIIYPNRVRARPHYVIFFIPNLRNLASKRTAADSPPKRSFNR